MIVIVLIFMFVAGFYSQLNVLNSILGCLEGCFTMSAFVVSCFLQVLLGLPQSLKRSPHYAADLQRDLLPQK